MRLRSKFTVIVITIITAALPLLAQDRQKAARTKGGGVFNDSSAPLQISRGSGNTLKIKNVSTNRVVGFHLGCVLVKRRKFRILSKRSASSVYLPPPNDARMIYFKHDAEYCSNPKARLTVVEIAFDDGSVWMFRQAE